MKLRLELTPPPLPSLLYLPFQMMFGLIFGLTMPLFIPKVLLYEAGEKQNEIGEVIHCNVNV